MELICNNPDSLRKDFEDLCSRENLSKETLNEFLSNPVQNLTTIKKIQEHIHPILEQSLAQSAENYEIVKSFPTRHDSLLIKGFPFTSENDVLYGELLQLGMARLFNMNPFTYASEYSGRLLHHVRPQARDANKQTGLSSHSELHLHMENLFDVDRPDFLSLYCLNGNRNAKTSLIAFQDVIELADEELKERILTLGKEKEFVFNAPESFGNPEIAHVRGELVYEMPDGSGLGARYNYAREVVTGTTEYGSEITGATERASQLLNALNKFIDVHREELDGKMSVVLEQGDLLVWNNHKVMHGRSAYNAKFDDKTERFLVRMYMCKNLDLAQFRE